MRRCCRGAGAVAIALLAALALAAFDVPAGAVGAGAPPEDAAPLQAASSIPARRGTSRRPTYPDRMALLACSVVAAISRRLYHGSAAPRCQPGERRAGRAAACPRGGAARWARVPRRRCAKLLPTVRERAGGAPTSALERRLEVRDARPGAVDRPAGGAWCQWAGKCAAMAAAQLLQQNAWSPRDTIVISSTIGALQWAQRRSPGWSGACGSEPIPICCMASEQLGQQYVLSPATTWVVGSTMGLPQ